MNIKINWTLTFFVAAVFIGSAVGQFTYSVATDRTMENRIEKLEDQMGNVQAGLIDVMSDVIKRDTEQSIIKNWKFAPLNPNLDDSDKREDPNTWK